jgi:hypothetical protein
MLVDWYQYVEETASTFTVETFFYAGNRGNRFL